MPFGGLGFWEILLIMVVLLLVFGAKRLPELGGALGKGIREFKGSIRDIEGELKRPADEAASRDREVRAAPRNEAIPGGRTEESPAAQPENTPASDESRQG